MVYHANSDNGSNTKKGFYQSYKKAKTNFEDDTSRLDLEQQRKLDDAYAELWIDLWVPQVKNFSTILAKMQSNGIFLQEPKLSFYKNQCLDLQK